MVKLNSKFRSRRVMQQCNRVLEAVKYPSLETFQYLTGQGSEQHRLALETALLGLQLDTLRGPFQLKFFIASLIVRIALFLLHECTVPNIWDLSSCLDSTVVGTMMSELETVRNVQY